MPDHHGHAFHARRLVKVQTNKSEKMQLCPMTREQIEREIEDLEAHTCGSSRTASINSTPSTAAFAQHG
jgi:hypothetical protein